MPATPRLRPPNPHSLITDPRSPVSFLVTDCPQSATLADEYLGLLQSHGCSHLVRCCDPNAYDATPLKDAGIVVLDWFFEDGSVPPDSVIISLRDLISTLPPSSTIALHCVSGIGRAPVLVAAALVDQGIDPTDAVDIIRKHRRGALNRKQLAWLVDDDGGFKKLSKKRKKGGVLGKLFGRK
ncbi:hypothetical protein HDU86_003739 [Geranomyces michiganensis]|nr:hypothetical protein HDU86_003739 [Geranomyces michiganensis]